MAAGRLARMTRYVFVGQSSPVDGREEEYVQWYLNRHLPAMLQCAGVVSVRRFGLADSQLPGTTPACKYLAIYEIETEAARTFVEDMLRRAVSGILPSSNACWRGA